MDQICSALFNACNSRDQWCDEPQASMPTRHCGSFSKNASTWQRLSCRRMKRTASAAFIRSRIGASRMHSETISSSWPDSEAIPYLSSPH